MGAAKPDVVVGVRRRIVRIQGKDTGIRAIVPVAAADQGRALASSPIRTHKRFALMKIDAPEIFQSL